jgi:hypothetical protein
MTMGIIKMGENFLIVSLLIIVIEDMSAFWIKNSTIHYKKLETQKRK